MRDVGFGWFHTAAVVITFITLLPSAAPAGEATGKVVFIDAQNRGLLIEVPKDGGGIPGAKEGETFTFVIPAQMAEAARALKEGERVRITFEEAEKDGPRTLTAVTKQ